MQPRLEWKEFAGGKKKRNISERFGVLSCWRMNIKSVTPGISSLNFNIGVDIEAVW